ncbi:hypothetical protein ACFX2I_012472 [Malus domestica]|uniref:Defensin-like protein n=1 Tax=Malus domestica TaxID=3750 RepID=A0A498KRM0_MALDO|nr:hypothetical protein DVH24_016872 [Malus domestica]
MAKFYAFFYLLVLLRFTSVNAKVCRLATIGGGCPDVHECNLTCSPCYRNVGRVTSYCDPGGEGFPFGSCVCVMSDGAPCNPRGPPKCPNWPRSVAANATNFTANYN